MKIDEILKLVNAGYNKEEIDKFDDQHATTRQATTQQATTQQATTQQAAATQQNGTGFDYDKFAAALVKAQQLANGRSNFSGSNDKQDISKFF